LSDACLPVDPRHEAGVTDGAGQPVPVNAGRTDALEFSYIAAFRYATPMHLHRSLPVCRPRTTCVNRDSHIRVLYYLRELNER